MTVTTTVYGGSGDPKKSIELLWDLQEKPRRGPKPRLTVDAVARTAIEIADRDGLAALSMRRMADELGVTAKSLYTYVPGKAELIDLMVDRVHRETLQSGDLPEGWRSALEKVARENRRRYLRHPWLLQVALTRPVLGPNIIATYDRDLRAVTGIGLSEVEMDLVINMISDYVHGAARGAIEAAQAERQTGVTDQEWWDEVSPFLASVFDADRFPVAAEVGAKAGAEYNAASDPDRAFEFGLRRILDGVAALIDRDH